jgi:hypothetical protein
VTPARRRDLRLAATWRDADGVTHALLRYVEPRSPDYLGSWIGCSTRLMDDEDERSGSAPVTCIQCIARLP